MPIVEIKNNDISVQISSFGAEIVSVKDKHGKEYIWGANPNVWGDHAPVLFPIVSRLTDGKYSYNGKEYSMPMHGFASKSEFKVEECDLLSATFLLTSNAETLEMYPFEFEFRVRYAIAGRKLKVDFITNNKTKGNLYYSAGSHEGYAISGGVENYSIVFDENETLSRYEVLPTGILCETPILCLEDSREFKLDDKYFEIDAIIFLNSKNRGVALRDDRTGESIHVAYPDCETLLIWKKPDAEYVCIEPWSGAPILPWLEMKDFSEKYGIRELKEGESEILTHTITF